MSEEVKDPLIEETKEEKPEEVRDPFWDMLRFFKTSFLPTIATIFHPMY